ncbi:threonine ammonia-lyase [Amycolatopsis speibonae]|uniref:Threonine/serine dehydratase n=1 Tax=Amycolatopsis speibonae TaxID=1450224 RepID=A0ABV7PCV7_9PSEU
MTSLLSLGLVETPVRELPGHGWRRLAVKDETLQTSGAFKFRGVARKISTLPPGTPLTTASTGNHGAALAIAGHRLGNPVRVFVPASTPRIKLARIVDHGAEVHLEPGQYDDAEAAARTYARRSGAYYVPSFDDPEIIKGHQTMFAEAERQNGRPDVVFVPVGGGGLASAALTAWPGTEVVGVEHASAPAMRESLRRGSPWLASPGPSPAEGLLVRRIGALPLRICQAADLRVELVTDDEIADAIRVLHAEAGIRAEFAGAAALAVALRRADPGRKALCVVSGGNIDDDLWRQVVRRPDAGQAQGLRPGQ